MSCLASILLCLSLTIGHLKSSPVELIRSHATVLIEDNTLRGVSASEKFLLEGNLDLSNLSLQRISPGAFDNVSSIRNLSLADNDFRELPSFVFRNLTNLEELSLADNRIRHLRNTFQGLGNLRRLDFSRNTLTLFQKGYFFGLVPKNVEILVEGNHFYNFYKEVFQDPESKRIKPPVEAFQKESEESGEKLDVGEKPRDKKLGLKSPKVRIQVCLDADSHVKSLEMVPENQEQGPNDCHPVEVIDKNRLLNLTHLGIKGFQENWYELPQNLEILTLDLSGNEIEKIRREDFQNLPTSVSRLHLNGNKLEKLAENCFSDFPQLQVLTLNSNRLKSVEKSVFDSRSNLSSVSLSWNRLKDLSFLASFPKTLKALALKNNSVEEIPENLLLGFENLKYINLENNKIRVLRKNDLRGLPNLEQLDLAYNEISIMENEVFDDLSNLKKLSLDHNSLKQLQPGIFDKMENLRVLSLSWNQIRAIPENCFSNLSRKLRDLNLNHNEIELLERNSFGETPKNNLNLNFNKIEKIEENVFQSEKLHRLDLSFNKIKTLRNVSLKGLKNLSRVNFLSNEIQEIPKNSFLGNGRLIQIGLDKNPFEVLENGAFYGIHESGGIRIHGNKIRIIKGGLFEEAKD